jgi:hypothetical protein
MLLLALASCKRKHLIIVLNQRSLQNAQDHVVRGPNAKTESGAKVCVGSEKGLVCWGAGFFILVVCLSDRHSPTTPVNAARNAAAAVVVFY